MSPLQHLPMVEFPFSVPPPLQKNWIPAWVLLHSGISLIFTTIPPRKQRNDTPGWPVPVCHKPQLPAVPMDYGFLLLCLRDPDWEGASSTRELLSAWSAL